MRRLMRAALAAVSSCAFGCAAFAQSSPGFYTGQVPTAAQWNSFFAGKQDLLTSGSVAAGMLASGAAAANIGLASNLAALQAISAPAAGQMADRQGYFVPGDGGAASYVYSTAACTLNSGAGDNGAQVKPASGNGCWNIVPSPGGIDVRVWGVVFDGATDNLSAFTAALANSPSCVIVPAAPLWPYVSGPIAVPRCLRGAVWSPNQSTASFANASGILCNNQAVGACVVVNRGGSQSAEVENITLLGKGTTPVSGSIGFQWQGGYDLQLRNVQAANFDHCAYFGPTAAGGGGPITAHVYGSFFSRCKSNYVVDDGIPELYFIGGRWGENGSSDYDADHFIYATKTTSSGAGGGPNTIVLDSMHLNPGGHTIGCAFGWGGFAYATGTFGANKIVNSHIEVTSGSAYTGSAMRGIFCMDSTVPALPGLFVSNSDFSEDGTKSIPFFNIATAVPWTNDWRFVNSTLCSAPFTLTIKNLTGSHAPTFDDDYICGGSTFTAGDATAQLTLSNSTLGVFTISGQWNNLALQNIIGTITDNATGAVYESGDAQRTWMPALQGSTTAGTFTYTTQTGRWLRTPGGGLWAYFNIAISSTSGAAGNVQITGLPKTCSARPLGAVLTSYAGFTGLTGPIWAAPIGGSANFNLLEPAAGGTSSFNVPVSALTSSTSITGTVTCGLAL